MCAGELQPGQGSWQQYGLLSETVVIRAGLPSLLYHTMSPLQTKGVSMGAQREVQVEIEVAALVLL